MKARELVTNDQVEMSMRMAGYNEKHIYCDAGSGPSPAYEMAKEGLEAEARVEILNGVKEYLESHDIEQKSVAKICEMLIDWALSDDDVVNVFEAETKTIYYKAYEMFDDASWWFSNLYDGSAFFDFNLLDGMLTVDRLISQKLVAVECK